MIPCECCETCDLSFSHGVKQQPKLLIIGLSFFISKIALVGTVSHNCLRQFIVPRLKPSSNLLPLVSNKIGLPVGSCVCPT